MKLNIYCKQRNCELLILLYYENRFILKLKEKIANSYVGKNLKYILILTYQLWSYYSTTIAITSLNIAMVSKVNLRHHQTSELISSFIITSGKKLKSFPIEQTFIAQCWQLSSLDVLGVNILKSSQVVKTKFIFYIHLCLYAVLCHPQLCCH